MNENDKGIRSCDANPQPASCFIGHAICFHGSMLNEKYLLPDALELEIQNYSRRDVVF